MSRHNGRGVPPEGRQAALIARRNLKMAASAHAYVRGSTTRFYEWLEASGEAELPEGPNVWIGGDCHLGNIGPVAAANGALDIQIRDLDQTVIGNPAHDLVRLGLSLASAARSSDLPGVTTARMIEHMIDGYERAFEDGTDGRMPEVSDLPNVVRRAMRDAAGRSWKHLADERIEGVEPVIPLGRRFWPLLQAERGAIEALFAEEEPRGLVAALRDRDGAADVEVADAAYWRKGCSSLGRARYAVLLRIKQRGAKSRHCLMDIKEATTAAAPRRADADMPRDNAARVVEGARNLAPHLGSRMRAARLQGKAVVIRELLPQDLKIEVERFGQAEVLEVASCLAGVVGRAHARQLGTAERAAWLRELQKNRSSTLDAPSWLWRAVVELMANHESAYLEHCRRYASGGEG
jgi:uncharacterized protein (DUF2252 family)